MNNDTFNDRFSFNLIVILMFALFATLLLVINNSQTKRIDDLEYALLTFSDADLTLFESLDARTTTNSDILLQMQVDTAWETCRIYHDLDVLFGGNYYVESRLNYKCTNQFYLDEKPTVDEMLGE